MQTFLIPIASKTVPPVAVGALEVNYFFQYTDEKVGDHGLEPTIHSVTLAGIELPHELLNMAALTEAAKNNYYNG